MVGAEEVDRHGVTVIHLAVGKPAAFCVLKGVSRRLGLCPQRDQGGGRVLSPAKVGGCPLLHQGHHLQRLVFRPFFGIHFTVIRNFPSLLFAFFEVDFGKQRIFW